MIQAVTTCFKKYLTFSGRAARSEFWYFILFLALAYIALMAINLSVFGPEVFEYQRFGANGELVGTGTHYDYHAGILGDVFLLITFLPWLAVGWRRMHDSNRPGYLPWLPWLAWIIAIFLFVASQMGFAAMVESIRETGRATVYSTGFAVLMLTAAMGSVVLNLYWLTRPSDIDENKYGPNPMEVAT